MFSSVSLTLSNLNSPVLEARHIIFLSILRCVNPGVSFSIRNAVNSGLPSFSPDTTCIVLPSVIGVALLVMNILEPLTIHSPSTSLAVDFVPLESQPAVSSVRPKPQRCDLHKRGRYLSFCSLVPYSLIGVMPKELSAAIVAAVEPSTRASSSTAIIYDNVSRPWPPYSSGTHIPSSPRSAIFFVSSTSNFSCSSFMAATGFTSLSAKSRTLSRNSLCFSVSPKFISLVQLISFLYQPCRLLSHSLLQP